MRHSPINIAIVMLNTAFMVFPSSYQWMKAGYLLAFACIFILLWYGNRIELSRDILFIFLVAITLGMFLNLYDLYENGEGFVTIKIYVLDVLAYLLVVAVLSSLPDLRSILSGTMYLASLVISLNIVAFILCSSRGIQYPLEFLDLDYRIGFDERGFLAYSTNNLPVLIFTIPYMVADLFLAHRGLKSKKAILALSIIAGLLSLRTALIATMLASMVVFYLYGELAVRKRYVRLLAVLATIMVMAGFSPLLWKSDMAQGIYQLKIADKLSGDDYRFMQARIWADFIKTAPLLGHGTSSMRLEADKDGMVTSKGKIDNPYGYELSWLRRIALTGAIPTAIYTVMLLYLAGQLMVQGAGENRRAALGLLGGLLAFIVADNTNGYLETFGYLWVIFFPAAFVSCCRLTGTEHELPA